jgi:acetylornithine deacetylase
MGTGSLHASIIEGGRELSSYPDRATLQMERRTLPGEAESTALSEVQQILGALSREDTTFRGSATAMFSRPAYEVAAEHELPQRLSAALARAGGRPRITGRASGPTRRFSVTPASRRSCSARAARAFTRWRNTSTWRTC